MLLILFFTPVSVYAGLRVELPGGDEVAFSGKGYAAPLALPEVADEYRELETATTYDLFVSTTNDILVVDFDIDVSAGSVYQGFPADRGLLLDAGLYDGGPFFTNVRPPPAPFHAWHPQLGADSWVATPGTTACAQVDAVCPGFENAGQVSHFDSDNDGAQSDFNFARITMLPDGNGTYAAEFRGVVYVADQPLPIAEPFHFTFSGTVPEPGSRSLLLAALLGGLAIIRRHS